MTKPTMNWIGHTIGGRYKIEALLGHGGMSTVYKAYDPNLKRTIAVKMIHSHLSSDPEFVRRFEQEAAAVAQLRHPNIIQVYDFSHDKDTYYMVLDYIPGKTLKERLQTLNSTKRQFPLPEVIRIMGTICEAVTYAHQQGMIHRDLKPANLMLTPQGYPILMDFGVAKILGGGDYTATGTIVGTAKYMSPEQARSEHPDERSDIYSLGVILFELVAGQPPFEADTSVAVLMKHVFDPVPDIRKMYSNIPPALIEIIEKSLDKDPNDRYQTVAHLAAALKLVDRFPQSTTPAKNVQRTIYSQKQKTSRRPTPTKSDSTRLKNSALWLTGAVAVIVLTIVAGLGAYFIFSRFIQPSIRGDAAAQSAEQVLPSSEGMVRIGDGMYSVGIDSSDREHAPVQPVELAEFWIDQKEVTNAQYAKFLAQTDDPPPADWSDGNIPSGQENHPVEGVSWDLAATYCQWVNKRLPTEAEWEIAARGTDGRLYPWGDKRAAVDLPRTGTYEVGSKTTNQSPFGVFDMAGNVWEWVGDGYAPVTDSNRILRGGSNGFLKDMAYRLQGDPNLPTMIATAGIRCAADRVHIVQVENITDENVLYYDNFVNPGSGWPIESEGDLFFGYHPPDYYHLEVGKPDNYAVITHPPDFNNISIETEVLVDHTDTETGTFRYGLAVRRLSKDQYYAFVISSRLGTWQVLKSTPSGLETLAEGTVDTLRGFAPKGFTPDQTDLLRIEANGPELTYLINGQVVAKVNDTDYTNGEAGFFVETFDETLAHVHYDSLTIRQAEAG